MLGSEHDDFDPTPLARLQDGSGCGRRRLAAIFAMTGLCAGGLSLKRLNKPKLPMWSTAEVGGVAWGSCMARRSPWAAGIMKTSELSPSPPLQAGLRRCG